MSDKAPQCHNDCSTDNHHPWILKREIKVLEETQAKLLKEIRLKDEEIRRLQIANERLKELVEHYKKSYFGGRS